MTTERPLVAPRLTKEQTEAFHALRNPDYGNFVLLSGHVNGEPAAMICVLTTEADGGATITPMYVEVTKTMILTNQWGDPTQTEAAPGAASEPAKL